jgi:polyisoprenoid-binding protein YceI
MRTALGAPTRRTIAPARRWTVDPRHSAVEFAIKHLAIATIKEPERDGHLLSPDFFDVDRFPE